MPLNVPNWAAVAVLSAGLILSYYSIRNLNQEIIDATEVPTPDPPSQGRRLDPDGEDKIPLDSLRVLSQSHSFELRNAAIKVIAARFMKDLSNRNHLLSHIAQGNWQQREDAINALWLLMYGLDDTDKQTITTQFTSHATITSLISGLINVLPDHKHTYEPRFSFSALHPPSPVRPFSRPVHETSLLIPLRDVLRGCKTIPTDFSGDGNGDGGATMDTVSIALEAGLVSKWLTNYPFPCTLPQYAHFNYKKADVVSLLAEDTYWSDDVLMAQLVRTIAAHFRGRKELVVAGLMRLGEAGRDGDGNGGSGRFTEDLERGERRWDPFTSGLDGYAFEDGGGDVRMTNGEDTAGLRLPPIQWVDVPRSRPRSGNGRSQGGDELRRRHREAIVVAERGVPLTSENVIQRRATRREEELEEEVEERMRTTALFSDMMDRALSEDYDMTAVPPNTTHTDTSSDKTYKGGPVTVTWTVDGEETVAYVNGERTEIGGGGGNGAGEDDAASERTADSMPELEEIVPQSGMSGSGTEQE